MAENLVTVFIPCFNAEEYIEECIDSILNQTYQDFDILIIDDGSTDGSLKCIEAMADKRIRLIRNETNLGIVGVLNKGFDIVETPYMIRQDADDFSAPDRLERLVNFMNNNLDVDICGSGCSILGEVPIAKQYPQSHEEIVAGLLIGTPIQHGMCIFRLKNIISLDCRYEEEFRYAEDFRFFTKYWNQLRFHNLVNYLYYYRLHENQISTAKRIYQKQKHSEALSLFTQSFTNLNKQSAAEFSEAYSENKFGVLAIIISTKLLFKVFKDYRSHVAGSLIKLFKRFENSHPPIYKLIVLKIYLIWLRVVKKLSSNYADIKREI